MERPWQYIQHPATPEGVVKDGLTVFWLKVLERQGWKVRADRRTGMLQLIGMATEKGEMDAQRAVCI